MQEREAKLNQLLLELFIEHGVSAEMTSEGKVSTSYMRTHCSLFDKTSTNITVVQLDVSFQIGLDKTIIESSAGIGSDLDDAIADAFRGFVANSFHVILDTFCNFSQRIDDYTTQYEWQIADKTFNVVASTLAIRGKAPDLGNYDWLDQFRSEVEDQSLSEGIHWIRLFYSFMNDEVTSCEVLLDNLTWNEVQSKASNFNLPKSQDYCSLRTFYTLQNGWDIGQLAAIMAWTPTDESTTYHDFYVCVTKSYNNLGISYSEASKAFYFIPLAVSHAYFEKISFHTFPTKVIIINEKKERFTIDLKNEPRYIQIYEWTKQNCDHLFELKDKDIAKILWLCPLFTSLMEQIKTVQDISEIKLEIPELYIEDYQ